MQCGACSRGPHLHTALPLHLERTMLAKLTRHNDIYLVPEQWKRLLWARDFGNYPDPDHSVFENEYDWYYRNEKGLLYSYFNHIEGSGRLAHLKEVKRQTTPKPESYYIFALVAIYLINSPNLIRDVRSREGLHGGFVVNYANSIPVSDLFPPENNDEHAQVLVEKLKNKKHIIPVTYSSLFARVFNATSGILDDDKILTNPREAKLIACANPACKCVFESLSREYWLPTDAEYAVKSLEASYQIKDRISRDMTGHPVEPV